MIELTPPEQVIAGWVAMALVMLALWESQRRTQNAGIVDVAWAAGVGALAIFFAFTSGGDLLRRLLVGSLAGIWSLRLAFYLLVNRYVGKPEDGRYRALRHRWAGRANALFFLFFQLQASWALLFALPALVVAHHAGPLQPVWTLLALATWTTSVLGETIADLQLARWRADPANRGKTCRHGLWRYSRHPNYFFEWVHWWTYVFLAVGSPFLWLSIVVAGIMLVFLLKLTGIPYTEQQASRSREDYRTYQKTTSIFIPWFPSKEVS